MSPSRAVLSALALCSLVSIAGCPWIFPGGESPRVAGTALRAFSSEAEVREYFRQELRREQNAVRGFDLALGGFGAAPEATNDADSGGSFTTTNIQEQGVDEADVFKSDGQYFYVADNRTIRIVQANPPTALEEVATVELDNPVVELYLFGSTLIALGHVLPDELQQNLPGDVPMIEPAWSYAWPPYYAGGAVAIAVIDISDPTNPELGQQVTLDGNLAESRLAGGRLIIVATLRPAVEPGPFGGTTVDEESLQPMLASEDGAVPLVAWTDWYRPDAPAGIATTVVSVLDAADIDTLIGSLAVVAETETIYMAPDALYLTDAAFVDPFVSRPATGLHKITFPEGVPTYAASGVVPGRPLNQFSLDAVNGELRIATHVRQFGLFPRFGAPGFAEVLDGDDVAVASEDTIPRPYNALYVLEQDGDSLEVVGAVEQIAPGERIYAVRFFDTHAFVVTFEQIDPLFVIDLADPSAPTVVGELKIPGYSDYLHPLGEDRLIGIGRTTGTAPWGGVSLAGIQLSLFDVSDWSNPEAIEQLEVGGPGSVSDVSFTHKAFTFLAATNTLALPATVYPADEDGFGFVAPDATVLVFRVDPDTGFEALGDVELVGDDVFTAWLNWRRAAIIGEDVYAISPAGVRGATIGSFATTTTVEFE
jgi:uncharacterized secreted protein with C-terminal beta-propeller domain